MKLLIGGSPCTHWSIAKTKNRETEASGLGWELFLNYKIARDKYKPDFFLYENNKSMSPAIREQITKELGVEPVLINSALVSAQNRKRLYWAGKRNQDGTYSQVMVEQPEDRGLLLRDVLETSWPMEEKAYTLSPGGKPLTEAEMEYMVRQTKDGRNHFDFEYFHDATKDKSAWVTANTHKGVPYNVLTQPIDTTAQGKAQCLRATYYKDGIRNLVGNTVDRKTCVAKPVRVGTIETAAKSKEYDSQQCRVYSPNGKSVTLCAGGGGAGAKTGLYATPICEYQEFCDKLDIPVYRVENGYIEIKGNKYPIKLKDGCYIIRKLTVKECKRLQTVPDHYIFPVSNTQAYKMLGNGWTVDVIAHIMEHFSGIKKGGQIEVLSMYDGMSCGHIALDKLGANVTAYYATEIDKYAIQTTQHNYPDTVQLGDAFQVREDTWSIPPK